VAEPPTGRATSAAQAPSGAAAGATSTSLSPPGAPQAGPGGGTGHRLPRRQTSGDHPHHRAPPPRPWPGSAAAGRARGVYPQAGE